MNAEMLGNTTVVETGQWDRQRFNWKFIRYDDIAGGSDWFT